MADAEGAELEKRRGAYGRRRALLGACRTVHLRVSQVVDVANVTVTAPLPAGIF